MNNKEYLTEERYTKVNKTLKTLYLVLSIIGIAMIIAGVILLVITKDNYFSIQKLIATILIVVGVALSVLSIKDFLRHTFTRDIVSYYAQQQMPIAKEGIEKMAPSAGVAAKKIAKGVKEGLKDDEK